MASVPDGYPACICVAGGFALYCQNSLQQRPNENSQQSPEITDGRADFAPEENESQHENLRIGEPGYSFFQAKENLGRYGIGRSPSTTSSSPPPHNTLALEMSYFPQPHPHRRAPRFQLADVAPAVLQLGDERRTSS